MKDPGPFQLMPDVRTNSTANVDCQGVHVFERQLNDITWELGGRGDGVPGLMAEELCKGQLEKAVKCH